MIQRSAPIGRGWVWMSAVGLLLFLLIQIFPMTGQLFESHSQKVLTRAEAERQAIRIASDKFGIAPDDVTKTTLTHVSDSKTIGYFSKNGLVKAYNEQWMRTTPADVYIAQLRMNGIPGTLSLHLNMETGELVSWSHAGAPLVVGGREETGAEAAAQAAEALSYAAWRGVDPEEWTWTGAVGANGAFEFDSRKAAIGEASLRLAVVMPERHDPSASAMPAWQGGSVAYEVRLPADFLAYMKKQEDWSAKLSLFGFLLPQVLLFVLAIVYAGTHGGHTSYRRGIFLSIAFFVLYAGLTFNMLPGLRAGTWNQGVGDAFNLIVSLVTYAAMALLTYFSAVGGDGLWKSMGISLWPRWRETGYGAAVLASMKQGYFLAFILLGAQSFILLTLEKTIGSFTASDAMQSVYNMSIPLLLPLLAWCAGISEEIQSRLFGIGLLRKWLVGLARKLLGREPSRRALGVLTTIAIVPPGLMWALGHVGYAIFPVYTRVIELVLLSFLFGWFMLRFGLMAVIFAHVAVDAILIGMQLMFDGLPWHFAGGVASLLLPAAVGFVIYWLHGRLRGSGAG
ncbi:hypothetical protein ACF3MZ_15080 [Paenibacillaceae bacterium WGS1546]|uniref:hypothetical protein n=1 Tax=Cohnella sp. WGS1546 TaxID=3366810 RepID=UPI00372D372D